MSHRRHAARAVTAAAGIALVGAGGFGLLLQPHAAAAAATPNDICILPGVCIPTGGSSTPAPTTSPSPSSTTTSPAPSSTPSGQPSDQPSDQPSQSMSSEPTLYTVGAQPSATQAAAAGPAAGPNLTASHLVVRKLRGRLDVLVTVTNTGTVLMQDVPISVSASGVGTQNWTITLNPGQHLSFHTRWPFRATPRTKQVVVTVDPQGLFAETSKADNRVSARKTFR